ncbi:uncharacterized protein LOC144440735 [Glandiceps talaboti]
MLGFQVKTGFYQLAGAVDGSHIPILQPRDFQSDYYNRKCFHSVVLQAVVDHQYRFMDINVGWPGRVHDARILANSTLYQRGNAGELFPNWTQQIHGVQVPVFIIGDPAYPLLPWLMKPYPEIGNLAREKKIFNSKLSKARYVVEDAFGRLKGRWRCLMKRNDSSLVNLPNHITTCCILHNICEIYGDNFDEVLRPNNDDNIENIDLLDKPNNNACQVRNALALQFVEDRDRV